MLPYQVEKCSKSIDVHFLYITNQIPPRGCVRRRNHAGHRSFATGDALHGNFDTVPPFIFDARKTLVLTAAAAAAKKRHSPSLRLHLFFIVQQYRARKSETKYICTLIRAQHKWDPGCFGEAWACIHRAARKLSFVKFLAPRICIISSRNG